MCVNWVGCAIEDQRPTYWAPYDGNLAYADRIDIVANRMQESNVDLGLLYFEEPDHSCHQYGPDSPEVLAAIRKVDDAVVELLKKIDLSQINVIFTADHGGIGVSKDRIVVLNDHISEPYMLSGKGAVAEIWPINNAFSNVVVPNADCFEKPSIPSRLHYTNNRRIAPIVCIADLGWTLVQTAAEKARFPLLGSHGYDASRDPESPMRPIFIGGGPDFFVSRDIVEEAFENIHIFPLLAKLIEIEDLPPINGTLRAVAHLLKPESSLSHQKATNVVVLQW